MKAVSTLCATSTVGIAAVGYSLGHPDILEPYKTLIEEQHDAGIEEGEEGNNEADLRPTPVSVRTAPILPSTPYTPRLLNDDFIQRRAVTDPKRPLDLLVADNAPAWLENGTQDSPVLANGSFDLDERRPGSSAQSWLGRRSIVTKSTASPRDSIAVSMSNASSGPMLLPRPATVRRTSRPPPNKLVKRVPSRHYNGSKLSSTPDGKISTFGSLRRPATSHQRSATLNEQFLHEDAEQKLKQETNGYSIWEDDTSLPAPQTASWRMFFNARPMKYPKTRRGANVPTESSIKSISPIYNRHPTLLMPSMISRSATLSEKTAEIPKEELAIFDRRPIPPPAYELEPESPTEDAADRRGKRHSLAFGVFNNKATWISRSLSLRERPSREDSLLKRQSSAAILRKRLSISGHNGLALRKRDTADKTIFEHQPPVRAESMDALRAAANKTTRLAIPPTRQRPTTSNGIPAHSRHFSNAATSERASTLIGSDSDQRGLTPSEEEMDFHSETAFDSLRTGATTASNRVRLDTLFDTATLAQSNKANAIDLQDLLKQGTFQEVAANITGNTPAIVTSTTNPEANPASQQHPGSAEFAPSHPTTKTGSARADTSHSLDITSKGTNSVSQPVNGLSTNQLSLGKLAWDPHTSSTDPAAFALSADDLDDLDEDWDNDNDLDEVADRLSSPLSARLIGLERAPHHGVGDLSQPRHTPVGSEKVSRSALFGWAESPPSKTGPEDGGLVRPKTVHGKYSLDMRGGRPPARRPPNPHIRSQSVPAQDLASAAAADADLASRIGSLGLGNKVASEDWNEDFDFESEGENENPVSSTGERRVDSGVAMIVPQEIAERQANVLNHLGCVREFALIVEDLKRLRHHASEHDIIQEHADLWEEADGIIALATVDEEDDELLPKSPVASTFTAEVPEVNESSPTSASGRARRRSLLLQADDVFGNFSDFDVPETPPRAAASPAVERRDPSTAARDLVETIHKRRTSTDPVLPTTTQQSKEKMPFDTTTLRDLVTHANALRKNLAELVRAADSITTSPSAASYQSSPTSKRSKKKIPASWQEGESS